MSHRILDLFSPPGHVGPADGTTRLGFAVSDVDASIQSLEAAGGTVVTGPRTSEWGYRAVVRDPDGRAVERSISELEVEISKRFGTRASQCSWAAACGSARKRGWRTTA